jgi:hypothetical protein
VSGIGCEVKGKERPRTAGALLGALCRCCWQPWGDSSTIAAGLSAECVPTLLDSQGMDEQWYCSVVCNCGAVYACARLEHPTQPEKSDCVLCCLLRRLFKPQNRCRC